MTIAEARQALTDREIRYSSVEAIGVNISIAAVIPAIVDVIFVLLATLPLATVTMPQVITAIVVFTAPLIGTIALAPWMLVAIGLGVTALALFFSGIGISVHYHKKRHAVEANKAIVIEYTQTKTINECLNALLAGDKEWDNHFVQFINDNTTNQLKAEAFQNVPIFLGQILYVNHIGGYQDPLTEEQEAWIKGALIRIKEREKIYFEGESLTRIQRSNHFLNKLYSQCEQLTLNKKRLKKQPMALAVVGAVSLIATSLFAAFSTFSPSLFAIVAAPIVFGSFSIPLLIPIIAGVAIAAISAVALSLMTAKKRIEDLKKLNILIEKEEKIDTFLREMRDLEWYLIETTPKQFSQKILRDKILYWEEELESLVVGLETLLKEYSLDPMISTSRIQECLRYINKMLSGDLIGFYWLDLRNIKSLGDPMQIDYPAVIEAIDSKELEHSRRDELGDLFAETPCEKAHALLDQVKNPEDIVYWFINNGEFALRGLQTHPELFEKYKKECVFHYIEQNELAKAADLLISLSDDEIDEIIPKLDEAMLEQCFLRASFEQRIRFLIGCQNDEERAQIFLSSLEEIERVSLIAALIVQRPNINVPLTLDLINHVALLGELTAFSLTETLVKRVQALIDELTEEEKIELFNVCLEVKDRSSAKTILGYILSNATLPIQIGVAYALLSIDEESIDLQDLLKQIPIKMHYVEGLIDRIDRPEILIRFYASLQESHKKVLIGKMFTYSNDLVFEALRKILETREDAFQLIMGALGRHSERELAFALFIEIFNTDLKQIILFAQQKAQAEIIYHNCLDDDMIASLIFHENYSLIMEDHLLFLVKKNEERLSFALTFLDKSAAGALMNVYVQTEDQQIKEKLFEIASLESIVHKIEELIETDNSLFAKRLFALIENKLEEYPEIFDLILPYEKKSFVQKCVKNLQELASIEEHIELTQKLYSYFNENLDWEIIKAALPQLRIIETKEPWQFRQLIQKLAVTYPEDFMEIFALISDDFIGLKALDSAWKSALKGKDIPQELSEKKRVFLEGIR